jgi:hypothetical protein
VKEEIEAWKPELDNRVNDLEKAVNHLGDRVEKLFSDRGKSSSLTEEVIDPSTHFAPASSKARATMVLGSAHLEPTPIGVTSGPSGHREEPNHRSDGFGVVYTTLDPPSITGAMNHTNPPRIKFEYDDFASDGQHTKPLHNLAMSDIPFPKFDGTNPKLWIKNYETFFDVYEVCPHLWIHYSTMHLTGSAALWYQTVQTTLLSMTWDDFCDRTA